MIDLRDCYYVIEIYTDNYKTLYQSITYRYNDNKYKEYIQSTINPNLKLYKRQYFKENDEYSGIPGDLIFTEYFE